MKLASNMVQTPLGPREKDRWRYFSEHGCEGFYDKHGVFYSQRTIRPDRMVLTKHGPRPTYVRLSFPEAIKSGGGYYSDDGYLSYPYPFFGLGWRGPLAR